MLPDIKGITLITDHVVDSEPCFGLAELNRVDTIPGHGVRRVQVIQVIRNDQIWEYTRDLGSASAFKTEEFILPGHVPLTRGRYDVIETVGRLRNAAEEYRAKYDKPTPRNADPTDFVKGFEEYASRRRDARKGRRRFAIQGCKR